MPKPAHLVAAFAATPMAAEMLLQEGLPLGSTQEDSERLLEETAQAQAAKLDLSGIQDIRLMLEAVQQGRSLHPLHLTAIASTLEAALHVEQQLALTSDAGSGGSSRFPALERLAGGIRGSLPGLASQIWRCIGPGDGRVLDSASSALADTRTRRQRNLGELRSTIEEWARTMHQLGAAERSQVVVRRDRLCVAVKAGRQSDLPKGSVTLATSSTGATFYMDPAPTVPLNNAEAVLAAAEREEVALILAQLSAAVADSAARIWQILDAVTALDICYARGRHADWCSGVRPRFLHPEDATQQGTVQVEGMRHPLLLQRSLPPLPPIPLSPAQDLDTSFLDLVGPPSSSTPVEAPAEAPKPEALQPPPRAVDFTVPAGARVVTVTGPNTGGKTAALKALGLTALMPKAGLFLPLQPPSGGEPRAGPAVAWFDAVLADVGDGQSLQQSLSTFSGHIRRVRAILAAITPRSLVLLDEAGSGTDPGEGAALAGALLTALADRTALTLATTHHASLKELAAKDARFCNAGVEFDLASLKPTYRLVWGSVGASNALAVAEGLGFDPLVIAEACKVAADAAFAVESEGSRARAEALRESLREELGSAKRAAAAAAAARLRAQEEVACLEQQLASVQQQQATPSKAREAEAKDLAAKKAVLAEAVSSFCKGATTLEEARRVLSQVRSEAPDVASAAAAVQDMDRPPVPAGWAPSVGEDVIVLSMGGAAGKVAAASGAKGRITVKVGKLTIQSQAEDLAPAQPADKKPVKPRTGSAQQQQKAKPSATARRAKSAEPAEGAAATQQLTIQFDHNSVDVRGMRVDEVSGVIDEAVAAAPSGTAVFIVHGMGTGRLKAEVHSLLKRSRQVARFEDHEASAGGCTMALIK
ncbi:g10789 [Coccomyxa elongata]